MHVLKSKDVFFAVCSAIVAIGSVGLTTAPAHANDTSVASTSTNEVNDLKAEIDALKVKLDLIESQQEEQARQAYDAAQKVQTAQAAAKAKAAKTGAGVHIVETAGTDVRLYGLIEATLANQTNASATGQSSLGLPVSWFSGNRWGIEVNQKLSAPPESGDEAPNKLNLIAKLESEFELPSGNMDTPGVLFNRDAWLGVQSKSFGKLTIGRQDTLPRDAAGIWGDPYGTSAVSTNEGNFTNVNNFKQIIFYMSGGNGAGGQGDTRYDSAFVYKKLFDNGLFLSAAYNFGDQNGPGGPNGSGAIAGAQFNEGSTAAIAAGYNAKLLHGTVYYTTGNVLESKTIGDTNIGHEAQSFGVGGNYDLGMFRLNAGFIYYTGNQGALGQRYDKAWTVSTRLAPSKRIDYELGLQEFYSQNAAVSAAGYVLRPFVDATGGANTINGTRFTAYGSIILHPVPNVDLYVAGDDLLTGGGYLDGRAHGSKHENEIAAGSRFKF